jgi:hypothetical protein
MDRDVRPELRSRRGITPTRNKQYVRFQVLTAASMKFRFVSWDVLPCKIIVDRCFRGTCCLHHQGDDDGGSTYIWNIGRQLFYTAVHPRRQIWTSYSPPWELEISHNRCIFATWLRTNLKMIEVIREVYIGPQNLIRMQKKLVLYRGHLCGSFNVAVCSLDYVALK